MVEFEISELYDVKGMSGLWKFKTSLAGGKMNLFQNIISGHKSPFSRTREITALKDLTIIRLEKENLSLETVFDNLSRLEEEGNEIPKTIEGMNEETIFTIMHTCAPDFAENEFKPHHMDKILGWYAIINEALIAD